MKYFFILGNNPTLSLAELSAVLDLKNAELLSPDFLLWEIDQEIQANSLINSLGGTIKIGVIRQMVKNNDQELFSAVKNLAINKKHESGEGKFNFGFSDYGQREFNKKNLGLKLKKYFTDQKVSCRLVVSQEATLSSVVITQNKLISRGVEIVLIESGQDILIGETLAVQPFKDLSRRDYGRPARDDLSGMLPPKLTQIMINLAQIDRLDALIIDPFCGSGTILGEAMLRGYNNLIGSDISSQAIVNTKKNISWLRELYQIKNINLKLLVKNVIDLSKFIKINSVSAVITEPYLGPQRGLIEFKIVIQNLEELYTLALQEFYKVLKKSGRVVMVWPLFYGQKPINPDYSGFKIINLLPEKLNSNQLVKLTNRHTLTYGRPGQKVYREIVVLEKE